MLFVPSTLETGDLHGFGFRFAGVVFAAGGGRGVVMWFCGALGAARGVALDVGGGKREDRRRAAEHF